MVSRHPKINRIFVLLGFCGFICLALIWQLFRLQIVNRAFYIAKAEEGHLGYSEASARRGEILIKDHHSQDVFRLATNTALALFYADPTLIKDPAYLADKLSPLLFDKKLAEEKDMQRIRLAKRVLPEKPTPEELARIAPKTEEEMRAAFRHELFEKLSQKTRKEIILYKSPTEEMIKFLSEHRLAGITVSEESVMAYPLEIGDAEYAAKVLAPVIDIPYERLSELLVGRNRYVVLRQKTPPDVEATIRKLMEEDKKEKRGLFTGVQFQEKTYRYYPEGPLAAQIIGFMGETGGLYGIEKSFDAELRGKKGIFKTQLDATGQQVIVGDGIIIQPAVDGDSVVLTIDRSIQMEVERRLAKAVQDAKADSGLAIIMDPKTGRIAAMAHYPTFDPNEYGKALETADIRLKPEEIENIVTSGEPGEEIHYLYIDRDSNYRIQVFKELLQESGKVIVSKFKNLLGSGVYRNRAVADIYEPGSVFKVIAMSIALNDGDVTPNTTFNDTGPIKVDEFEIHNATDQYYGVTTMRTVLEKSLNTGMAFVARKMGRELFYNYLQKFGFGEHTYIEFDNEEEGTLKPGARWAESELVTYAFGQGIAVTPVQLVTAVSVLANNGILMKPHIVEEVRHADGKVTRMEAEQVRRVISEKTAATIGAMMVSVVENSTTRKAVVPGYHVAGKSGTAQTYKHGKPLTGPGTTITSFVGFAPLKDPKFVILVKIDRPRSSIWSESVAAPLFSEIAGFLLKYYNIPPDA